MVTRKPPAASDPESDPHHIRAVTDHAIRFMTAPRDQPFLCVVAHNALHRPELAPAALVRRFAARPGADRDWNRPVLAAMVSELDDSVGRLLETLRVTALERDTLVVFTSDHGAFGRSSDHKPLRGAKADLYEGGLRVPLLFRWPGHLAPAELSDPVFGTDLFPTLLDFAGCRLPAGLDGRSLRGLLAAGEPAPARPALYWHFPHYHHLGLAPSGAIRAGRHKLIEWFDRTIGGATDGPPYELYDLEADPGETRNLAAEAPALCADLAARLRAWRREVDAQEMMPNPAFDPARGGTRAVPPPGDPGNPYGQS
jgi:arylsulfatase A-like enzyme